jgi:riboflavin synthase alpha subunit
MRPGLRLTILSALISLLPGAMAADMSGVWKGAFDVNGTTVPVTINLKIDGANVTGSVANHSGTPSEIHDGVLAGDAVTFWVNTEYQGQTYKIVYKGKIAADQISFDFGTEDGSWSSAVTVKKGGPADAATPASSSTAPATAPAASPAAAPTAAAPANPTSPADVNGNWKGSFDLNGTAMDLTFRLKSAGNAVTGTVERPGAPPMEVHEGKLDGDTVSFWINTDYEGQSYTIVYKGKVAAGQIDFDFGTADQSWSATVIAKKAPDATPTPAGPAKQS